MRPTHAAPRPDRRALLRLPAPLRWQQQLTDASSLHDRHNSPALGPHPQRELTPIPRLGSACPRLGMAAGANLFTVASCTAVPSRLSSLAAPCVPTLPGYGRRLAGDGGPWSGASRASDGEPTRSARNPRLVRDVTDLPHFPDTSRAEVPRAVDRADGSGGSATLHRHLNLQQLVGAHHRGQAGTGGVRGRTRRRPCSGRSSPSPAAR